MPRLRKSTKRAMIYRIAELVLKGKTDQEIGRVLKRNESTICHWRKFFDEEISKAMDIIRAKMAYNTAWKAADRYQEALAMEGESQDIKIKQADLGLKAMRMIVPEYRPSTKVLNVNNLDIKVIREQNKERLLSMLNSFEEAQTIETDGNSSS